MSAQSRSVRMHVLSSATMSSARHASAQAVQVWAQSAQAWMQSASSDRSKPMDRGWDSIIAVACVMTVSSGSGLVARLVAPGLELGVPVGTPGNLVPLGDVD